MTIGTQHHQPRQSIVLQHSLMNDARAWGPKVHAVLLRRRFQEVKNLLVRLNTGLKIVVRTLGPHDQMITVDASRDSRTLQVAGHELQQGHLSRRILHVHTVRLEAQVSAAANVASIVGVVEQRLFNVVEMTVEDLLGEGEALLAQNATDFGVLVEQLLVGRREGLGGREMAARRRCSEGSPARIMGDATTEDLLGLVSTKALA